MLLLHNNSIAEMFTNVFPEHEWHRWKFTAVPRTFWMEPENQLAYMEWLRRKLGFNDLDDLYALKADHLKNNFDKTTLINGCTNVN